MSSESAKNPRKLSKKIAFTAIDKDGVNVALEKECWYGHILIHHKRQMQHRLLDIKSTIEHPDRIDQNFEKGVKNRVYFKKWQNRDPFGNHYLLVATEIVENNVARVLSAYPLFALPSKGDK